MSDEDLPSRSADFDALFRTVISDDANLQMALRRVAEIGCGLVPHCAAASVTIIERGRAVTVGSTDDTAQDLDDAQYEAHEGPCLSAAQERRTVRIIDTGNDERWPRFSARARAHGIHSSLSVPIAMSGPDRFAGFNLYGDTVGAFTDDDEHLCHSFAAQASIVVSNVQAYWAMFELSENLQRAMQTRAVIEQAKGALMSSHRIDADAAFELLRERSQRSNRKLRDVAVDMLDETVGGADNGSPSA